MAETDDFGEVYVSQQGGGEGAYEEDYFYANNQNAPVGVVAEAGEIAAPIGQEGEEDIYSFDSNRSNAHHDQGSLDIKMEDKEEEELDDDDIPKIILDSEAVENRGGFGRGSGTKPPYFGRGRPVSIIPGGGGRYAIAKSQQQPLQTVQDSQGRKNAFEIDLDSIEEKLWRKPGADITDYFNYGFNEETFRAYSEKQAQMRLELTMKSKIKVFEPPTDGTSTTKPERMFELQSIVDGESSGSSWKRSSSRREDWGGRGGFEHRRRPRQEDSVIQINATADLGEEIGRSTPDRIPDMVPPMDEYFVPTMPFPPRGFPEYREDRRRDNTEERRKEREKRSPGRSPRREERDKDRDREKRRDDGRRRKDDREDRREREDYRERDEYRDRHEYRERDEYREDYNRERDDYKEREDYKGKSGRDDEDRKRRRY